MSIEWIEHLRDFTPLRGGFGNSFICTANDFCHCSISAAEDRKAFCHSVMSAAVGCKVFRHCSTSAEEDCKVLAVHI